MDTGLGHWVEDPTMRLRCHKGEEVTKEYKYKYNNKTNTNTGEGVSDIELQFQFIDVSFHESNIIYQLLITLKTKVPHNKGPERKTSNTNSNQDVCTSSHPIVSQGPTTPHVSPCHKVFFVFLIIFTSYIIHHTLFRDIIHHFN